MAIIQAAVERKLSSLIGAKVTFEKFHVSPLSGTIEAAGVHVGDDQDRPILNIVLVRAQISIKRAIKGEIVVKSVTIEKPILHVEDHLPSRRPPPESHEPDDIEKTRWKFDIEKLLLVDGQITFQRGSYEIATGRVLAELKRQSGDYSITFLAEDVRRVDRPMTVGAVGVTGMITNAADLTLIPEAAMQAQLTLGDLGQITFNTPRVRSLQGEIELKGKITLAQLAALLPPRRA